MVGIKWYQKKVSASDFLFMKFVLTWVSNHEWFAVITFCLVYHDTISIQSVCYTSTVAQTKPFTLYAKFSSSKILKAKALTVAVFVSFPLNWMKNRTTINVSHIWNIECHLQWIQKKKKGVRNAPMPILIFSNGKCNKNVCYLWNSNFKSCWWKKISLLSFIKSNKWIHVLKCIFWAYHWHVRWYVWLTDVMAIILFDYNCIFLP